MCLAIYSPGKLAPIEHLREGFDSNRDGWGFAFSDGDGVFSFRGLSSFDDFAQQIEIVEGYPHAIHFRFATHGAVSLDNCHPFDVQTLEREFAVIHNGVLNWRSTRKASDTRCFVYDYLQHNLEDNWDDESYWQSVETIIGGSKMVILDNFGEHRILNESLGHWIDGIWYSNHSYMPFRPQPRYQIAANLSRDFWEKFKM